MDIGLRRLFSWVFVVADIPSAIIGADFLAAFDILVDCRHFRLRDKTTSLIVRGISSSDTPRQLAVLDPEPENPFRQLLDKYRRLTRSNFGASLPPQDVVHHIRATVPPVFSRSGRLAPSRLSAAKVEFEHVLQMGIIRQSENPWASPLHMVQKAATGDWRPCEDVSKMAVTIPFGLFEFPRMSFGLRNASQTFQRHMFDSKGIRPLLSKVAAIRDFPPPSSKRQMHRSQGMVNFYRRFLLHCTGTIPPLMNLLSGPKGSLKLSADTIAAFDRVKAALADATLLTHFSPDAPISLMVDAPNVSVGAVLQQHLAGHTQPLAFFSRKLSPAETRNSTFGRELLSVFLAAKRFESFLEDKDLAVFTYPKPL
nr:unnamed protein product [Spirometra erinaceieuropaei]